MAPTAAPRVRALPWTEGPAKAFARLRHRPGAFLLESARPDPGLGEWSFLGCEPYVTARGWRRGVELDWNGRKEWRNEDGLAVLRELLGAHSERGVAGMPFAGGAVGYFAYEWGAERWGARRPADSGPELPGFEFGFYDAVAAVRAGGGELMLMAHEREGRPAASALGRLARALGGADAAPRAPGAPPGALQPTTPELRSEGSREDYLFAVERIRERIAAGDIYQANLTQRWSGRLREDPFALYLRMRETTPAPFAAFLDFGERQIACASPERFLRVTGRRAESRPIKGTRPRDPDPRRDRELRDALVRSAKDRAELLMIVDLVRNDLGRVSEFGSVRVERCWELESHPTVHHLVATVSGELRRDCDALAAIDALFPGGSITGAPKTMAMRILAELEPQPRHAYTGALGYLGFDGACDLNIAIRSFFCRGGSAYLHAGGGVVWDSEPAAEYQEMRDKAAALVRAWNR